MKIHCGASTHQTSTKSKVRHFAQTHCLNPLLVNRERQALPQGDGCYWSCAKRHNLASCLGLKLTINAEKQQSDLCDTWLIPGLGSLKNSLFPNSLAVSWLWRCYSLMEIHTGALKAAGTTKKKLFVPLVIPNLRLRWEMQKKLLGDITLTYELPRVWVPLMLSDLSWNFPDMALTSGSSSWALLCPVVWNGHAHSHKILKVKR